MLLRDGRGAGITVGAGVGVVVGWRVSVCDGVDEVVLVGGGAVCVGRAVVATSGLGVSVGETTSVGVSFLLQPVTRIEEMSIMIITGRLGMFQSPKTHSKPDQTAGVTTLIWSSLL